MSLGNVVWKIMSLLAVVGRMVVKRVGTGERERNGENDWFSVSGIYYDKNIYMIEA